VNILDQFLGACRAYGNYLWKEITFQTNPWYVNYFFYLIALSLLVWVIEIAFPWRKDQKVFRKDFWLDTWYMFFNFFVFKLIFFAGLAKITSTSFAKLLNGDTQVVSLLELRTLPYWLQVVIFFLAMDFIQWCVHNLLHRVPFLWNFHKVHHSVEEMGYAAHLRYHWMETVLYEPAKYMILLLIGGFAPSSVFVVYYINIAIGHFNHANINLDYGPLRYILNNPRMHIWHHAKELPPTHTKGMNFGISLSVWDYIFRTNYMPKDGRDIQLGFPDMKKFPSSFLGQIIYPINKKK